MRGKTSLSELQTDNESAHQVHSNPILHPRDQHGHCGHQESPLLLSRSTPF